MACLVALSGVPVRPESIVEYARCLGPCCQGLLLLHGGMVLARPSLEKALGLTNSRMKYDILGGSYHCWWRWRRNFKSTPRLVQVSTAKIARKVCVTAQLPHMCLFWVCSLCCILCTTGEYNVESDRGSFSLRLIASKNGIYTFICCLATSLARVSLFL